MRSLRFRISNLHLPRVFMGIVMILLLLRCGDGSDQIDPVVGSAKTFSAPLPERIPAYQMSDLTAEVRVDGGAPIPITVDVANSRVQGTITDLSPGSHNVDIVFYLNGVTVAIGSATATVVSGQAAQMSFDMIYYPIPMRTGNDNTSAAGSEPTASATLPVNKEIAGISLLLI